MLTTTTGITPTSSTTGTATATVSIARPITDDDAIADILDRYAAWNLQHVGVSLWAAQPTAALERDHPATGFAAPGFALLARHGDEVVGIAAVRAISASTGELTRMFVDGPARGTGIGSRLLTDAIAEAARRDLTQLELETLPYHMPAAYSLYRSHGFARYEVRTVPELDIEVVRMHRTGAGNPGVSA